LPLKADGQRDVDRRNPRDEQHFLGVLYSAAKQIFMRAQAKDSRRDAVGIVAQKRHMECGDHCSARRSRKSRANSDPGEITSIRADLLVADVVAPNRSPQGKFPANRENNREISRI
jgi:hypothetical protein